jgi:hypothetical protein
VREARFADAERALLGRRLAADLACDAKEVREAALRPSRCSAFSVARDRFAEVFLFGGAPWPRA